MSKIDELIQELCPDGVMYSELGVIEDTGIIKLGRGNVISKKDIAEYPGDYPVYSSSASGSGEFGRYGKYMFDDERITWSIDGGGRFFFRPANKYSVTNVSGWMKVIKNDVLNSKFLFYVLSDLWKNKAYDYTKKAHPSVIRNEYMVPIPPLPIQQEIVRILDNFTKLEAELEAELEARKKQYDYYRNQLLTPKEIDGKWYLNGKQVEWKTLEDLCEKIVSGKNKNRTINGEYPVYGSTGIIAYSDNYVYDKECLLIARVGANAGLIHKAKGMYDVSDNTIIVKPKNTYHLPYAFHQLISLELNKFAVGGGQPLITATQIKNRLIPVPSLDEQKRIAAILDKFDALVNDISIGLPAETEARRRQYEYYRGKLLTFKNIEEAHEA